MSKKKINKNMILSFPCPHCGKKVTLYVESIEVKRKDKKVKE